MSWSQGQLKDVIELSYGKSLPERKRKEGSVPVYGSGGIGGFHNISLVEGPGVIVGRKGTIGSVYFEKNDFFPIDTVYFVRPIEGRITIEYSYYLLQSLPLEYLNSDAAVPGLNRDRAYALPVKVPNIDLQNRIVSVLTKYDDLIENNCRRIQLLEASANLLYREWFIYLRFPGHEHVSVQDAVPDGWAKKPLKQLITLNYGKALKAEDRLPGDYPVYGSSGEVGSHEKALVKGPGIIIGRKGNVGAIYWCSKDYWPIDTVYFINAEESNFYLYYALQAAGFINTDVAVPGLNRNLAYSREILVPDDKLIDLFLQEVTPIRTQIEKLMQMNEKLAEARDLLLPRLMSGEITV